MVGVAVDLRKIKKLIELVEESGIAELEVRDGEEAVRIVRPSVPTPGAGAAGVAPAPPVASAVVSSAIAGGAAIVAPMAGTFYAASAPDAAPFVQVGSQVEVGQVVCIIESMKMMNEIVADAAGTCVAVEVANGQAVGSGQVLLRLD